MDIIKVKNENYARYEELLLRRDQLRKEARIAEGLYIKEFGDLMVEVFEKQIACITKKKRISYYQMALNRGEPINQTEIDRLIAQQMKAYQDQLDQKIQENENAKKISEITSLDYLKIKRIYHRIAKKLHPDINPKTSEIPELMELWHHVVADYNANSLKDIEADEILVNKALEKIGIGNMEIEIPDIQDTIKRIEEEITHIMETDPYQYKYLIEDPEAVAEQKKALEDEKKNYEEYEKELDDTIDGLLKNGVRIVWNMV